MDWTEVHRHLEATTAAMERVITPGIDDKKRLLMERARTLAQEDVEVYAGLQYLEVVEFRLAGEVYGIETSYIREVYPLK